MQNSNKSLRVLVDEAVVVLGEDQLYKLIDNEVQIAKILENSKMNALVHIICEEFDISPYRLLKTKQKKYPRNFAFATLVHILYVEENLSNGEIAKLLGRKAKSWIHTSKSKLSELKREKSKFAEMVLNKFNQVSIRYKEKIKKDDFK